MERDLHFLHSAMTARCAARVDKHFEGYCSLQLMSAGEVELFYDQTRYAMTGVCYWAAMPGPHIRFHAAERVGWWTHRYVAFRGTLASDWLAAGLLPQRPITPADPARHIERFDKLLATVRGSTRWSHLSAINLLEAILLELAETPATSDRAPWLPRAIEMLEEAPESLIDYHDVAAALDLGFSTFRRAFKQQTGKSPHDYRIGVKVAAAKRLLERTDTPIKRIAQQLGYADVFYFSRQFRTETGLPPRAYRESVQR